MRWITDLKIQYKLLLLLFLPFILVIFLATNYIFSRYEEFVTVRNFKQRNQLNFLSNQLAEAVFRESTASLVFLSKAQDSQESVLKEARKKLDTASHAFIQFVEEKENLELGPEEKKKVEEILTDLKQLSQIRFQVDHRSILDQELNEYYTELDNDALDIIGLIGLSTHNELRGTIFTYLLVIQLMRALSMEENAVNQMIAEGEISVSAYNVLLPSILLQKKIKIDYFRTSDVDDNMLYENVMKEEVDHNSEELQKAILEKGPSKETKLENAPDWKKAIESKKAVLNKLQDALMEKLEKRAEIVLGNAKASLLLTTTLLLFALILSGILIYLILKSITRPLKEAVQIAELISKGDLTCLKVASDRKDEIGALESSWSKMISDLRSLTKHLKEEINRLRQSTQAITQAILDASSGTEETAVAVAETTTTVEELKQTADLSAAKAKDVLETTLNVVNILEESEKSIHATIDRMSLLQERMTKISESIQKLSEQSQEISEINNTVNDFAEQSNLLAINAGIEAAKAGDQGKGFAVVAAEIRNLAEQSKQATKRVHVILKDVQNAISAVVMTTEQGVKAVEQGIQQSNHTNNSLRSLSKSISDSEKAANQIEVSSRQQLIGVEQVTIAMSNIKEASSSHVKIMQQIKKDLEELNQVSQQLEELIQTYRT